MLNASISGQKDKYLGKLSDDLVVVVDKESEDINKSMYLGYFTGNIKGKERGTYTISLPSGEDKDIEGILLKTNKEHNLDEHTAEYLYLELTNACNFKCSHCGIKGDVEKKQEIISDDANYITPDFAAAFSESIYDHPFPCKPRTLFYGGGEPLISHDKFKQTYEAFKDLKLTRHAVITNGCSIPLNKTAFLDFMEYIGKPFVYFTLSKSHQGQYSNLIRQGSYDSDYIPDDVDPDNAIYHKIGKLQNFAKEAGIGFKPLILKDKKGKWSELEGDLRKHILKASLTDDIDVHFIEENEEREPCSQTIEMAVRFNGDAYPYCTDIFNGRPRLGTIGLLR